MEKLFDSLRGHMESLETHVEGFMGSQAGSTAHNIQLAINEAMLEILEDLQTSIDIANGTNRDW